MTGAGSAKGMSRGAPLARAGRFRSHGSYPHRAGDLLNFAGRFHMPILRTYKNEKSIKTYKIYIFKVFKQGKTEAYLLGVKSGVQGRPPSSPFNRIHHASFV
jgi:hypothetical protein